MSTLTSGQPRVLKRRKTHDRPERLTVGQYLLKRLAQIGVQHLFLSPHPLLENFAKAVEAHPKVTLISHPSISSCCMMADGYGKQKGAAAVAVQPMGAELLNTLMRASCESVPLVVIIGTSIESESRQAPPVSFDDGFSFLEKLFRQFSAAWTELADPKLAAKKIDRVLDLCLFYKKPVCIELPQEVVDSIIPQHSYLMSELGTSDQDTLDEVALELEKLLEHAKHPLLYVGREACAHKLEPLLLHFAERWHIPITAPIHAQNYLLQSHPNFCASIAPSFSGKVDLLINFGSYDEPLDALGSRVQIASTHVTIDYRNYPNIFLKDVLLALCALEPQRRHRLWHSQPRPLSLRDDITLVAGNADYFKKASHLFTGDVICSSIASAEYALSAAIGAYLASPFKRPIVLVDEAELRASLSELYFAIEQGFPLVLYNVHGHVQWLKKLFGNLSILRKKNAHIPPDELVLLNLDDKS